MNFRTAVQMVFFPLIFISCQKELSSENGQTLPPSSGNLLIAASLKNAVSEISYTYDYNIANLPIRNRFAASATGFSADGTTEVTRDATGKISFSRLIFSSNISGGPDTVNYEISRSANGKISHVLLKPADTFNFVGYDSLVYAYNASGKLSGFIVYLIEYGTGLVEPMQSVEVTYNGNNVVKVVEYELLGSLASRELVETVSVTYDDKPAARELTEDDFIANLPPANNPAPSVNNVISYSRVFAQDPDQNVTTEYKYIYGAGGKPISAEVTTIRPGLPNDKANMTFTYR
jgi:hypothetical protein